MVLRMELADCNERVGTWTFEILPNHGLELLECAGLNVELPFKVGAHLAFHLVDLEGQTYPDRCTRTC
jgi:hypothetical protein